MKHPATRELFGYWNELRGERAAPERSEIDPAAIRDVLADTFMLDVDLPSRFPFRLAGTRVNALFDSEQKGRSFLDLWRREERRNISAILHTVADGVCPVVAGGIASENMTRGDCGLELLLLPLRHHGRTHSRILGLIKLATRPTCLDLIALGPMSLRSLRVIDMEECEAQRPAELIAVGQSPGAFGDAETIPSHERDRPGPPRLRIIQGGLNAAR